MDHEQKSKSSKKSHEIDQAVKKGSSNISSMKKQTGLSKAMSEFFDSGADMGYRSEELSSEHISKSISSTGQSVSKEQCMRFDSGFGPDVFSPLTSESEIPCHLEDEKQNKNTDVFSEQQKQDPRLMWQSIYSQDKDGDTILHLAVCEARSDIIFPLIRQAPHPDLLDICNDLCQTPLHLSALMGKSNIVRRLVAAGATLDIQDHNGNTALHIASRNGDLDSVLALLEPLTIEDVDEAECLYDVYPQTYNLSYLLNLKNYEGQTSVHLAALGGFKKVLECLYDHGADINDKEGKSGKTALHYGVENMNYEIVQILVTKCHANITARNYAGRTPVHVAWSLYKRNEQRASLSIFQFLKRNLKDPWISPSSSDTSSDEADGYDFARVSSSRVNQK